MIYKKTLIIPAAVVTVRRERRFYNGSLSLDQQVAAEERIAALLLNTYCEGFSDEDAAQAGRDILLDVLREFCPNLLEGAKHESPTESR